MYFLHMLYKLLRRKESYVAVPSDLDIDQLHYRDDGDIAYNDRIKASEGYGPSWKYCITVAGNECLLLRV